MQKLMYAFVLLCSPSVLAKTMLDVSVLLNEQTSNKKRTIQVHRMFDVTKQEKSFS